MEKDLIENALKKLAEKIKNSKSIAKFIESDHLFENWIVVEFIEILIGIDAIERIVEIEKPTDVKNQHFDIFWNNYSVEFKIIGKGDRNGRAINWEKSSVKADVEKLKSIKSPDISDKVIIVIDYRNSLQKNVYNDYNILEKIENITFKQLPFYSNYIDSYQGTILYSYLL